MNTTHIAVVLDRSGSIAPIADDCISGFNKFLSDQQEIGNATITLVLFHSDRDVVYAWKPISEAPHLTRETFQIRDDTALLDAIGFTVNDTVRQLEALPQGERPDKVIVVIFTDGLENWSRHFTRDAVFKLIRERKEQHGWEFVFLGANQDAIQEGGKLGIDAGSSLTFSYGSAGTLGAFGSASHYIKIASTGAPASFSDEERETQERLIREQRWQRPSKN